MDSIVVAIYTHPEIYPPVLNVVDELSDIFNHVVIISRNLHKNCWKYPKNVKIEVSGQFIDIRESERKSTGWKINSFVIYTRQFYRILTGSRPEWVMCNDPISLFAFRLIQPFVRHPIRLWYHNHDIVELSSVRKFSIGYFAVKSESKSFPKIDLFTLPSESRIDYFPVKRLRGKYLMVPNYPSLGRLNTGRKSYWKPGNQLKLLYQGYTSDGHGLEEVITYLQIDTNTNLTIIGPGDNGFKRRLRKQATDLGVGDRVSICEPVPYNELQEITLSHHVGLAIHEPVNVAFQTAALASNKIYEYAASGLPILYYSSEHYIQYLRKYNWAFPTDLSFENLALILKKIQREYDNLSQSALNDFKERLNFGIAFKPVSQILLDKILPN